MIGALFASFLIGLYCAHHLIEISLRTEVVLFSISVAMVVLWRWNRREKSIVYFASICMIVACLAFAYVVERASNTIHGQSIRSDLEGEIVFVLGRIESMPKTNKDSMSFEFLVDGYEFQNADVQTKAKLKNFPTKLSLSWFFSARNDMQSQHTKVKAGQYWKLPIRLKQIHGMMNPNGFDYELWMFNQGIRTSGSVVTKLESHLVLIKELWLTYTLSDITVLVEILRTQFKNHILSASQEMRFSNLFLALSIGEQRGLSPDEWGVFNRTGTSHLISISGLHITMVAGLFAGVISWIWRRTQVGRRHLCLLCPAPLIYAGSCAVFGVFYAAIAGWGIPAQRTCLMILLWFAAQCFRRNWGSLTILFYAGFIVVVVDPWAILWPSFWLSFLAVYLLMLGGGAALGDVPANQSKYLQKIQTIVAVGVKNQIVVTIGLLPLTLYLFGQFSLISPFANAFAIPIVSWLISPLVLFSCLLPTAGAHWVLSVVNSICALLYNGLSWLSAFDISVWTAAIPPLFVFLIAMYGAVILILPFQLPLRLVYLSLLFPTLFYRTVQTPFGSVKIQALDVGQGSSIYIETKHHRLLYDVGPIYSENGTAGDRVIIPYLKGLGVGRVDEIVLSHQDVDHAGGLGAVLRSVNVQTLRHTLSENLLHWIVRTNAVFCSQGQHWEWDGVLFEVLHPDESHYQSAKLKPNGRSCVLKISTSQHSILLTGDIEAPQERYLIAKQLAKLKADVLLVPHHGSGTSSTIEFINAVNPDIAIIQSGYRNRYRHPKEEVVERYHKTGVRVERTDLSGAIQLIFGHEIELMLERDRSPRYWNWKKDGEHEN